MAHWQRQALELVNAHYPPAATKSKWFGQMHLLNSVSSSTLELMSDQLRASRDRYSADIPKLYQEVRPRQRKLLETIYLLADFQIVSTLNAALFELVVANWQTHITDK